MSFCLDKKSRAGYDDRTRSEAAAKMAKKEDSGELVVVDAKRYNKVKKALIEKLAGDKNAAPPGVDEKESTRELVVVDVKRYKKVKKALEASEERYRQLFENVPIGIYRTTPDGRIVDSNPALVSHAGLRFLRRTVDPQPGKRILPDAGYPRADFIKRLERDGEIKGLESIWKRKDGSAHPCPRERQADAQRERPGHVRRHGRGHHPEQAGRGGPADPHPADRDPQLHHLQGQHGRVPAATCWKSSWTACSSRSPSTWPASSCTIRETKKVKLLARRGPPTPISPQ